MSAVETPKNSANQIAGFAGWLSMTNEVTRTFLAAGQIPGLINIAGGLPDPSLHPAEEIAEIAERAIREHPEETLGYGAIEGIPELRAILAKRFSTPSCQLTADNVLVTTSGMQGLDLIGKVLLEEGNLVAGQYPTYLGALDAWRPRKPTYRNMDLTAANLDISKIMQGAKFAYAVPNFSNPTGRLVKETIREQLVDAARETGAWLVEDDPYATLNYEGPLPPNALEIAMREGDPGPVIYLGTISKMVSPGLRVGWMIAKPEMIEALTLAKQGSDMCTSGLTQRMTCEILKSDLIERVQKQAIHLYRARRDALCAALSEHLGDLFQWEVPAGGMFVWAEAKEPWINTDRLFELGLEEKVCVSPSSVFDTQGQLRSGIRLNFTWNDEDKLTEGVKRLARAVDRLKREHNQ